jgi:hypothetical protein
MLEKSEKELEDEKASVDKAKDEVKCLCVVAASMRSRLPSTCVVRDKLMECVRGTSGGGNSVVRRWIANARGGEEQSRQEWTRPGTHMLGGLPCAGEVMGPIDILATWRADFLAQFANAPRNDRAPTSYVPFANTHGLTWTWIQQFNIRDSNSNFQRLYAF